MISPVATNTEEQVFFALYRSSVFSVQKKRDSKWSVSKIIKDPSIRRMSTQIEELCVSTYFNEPCDEDVVFFATDIFTPNIIQVLVDLACNDAELAGLTIEASIKATINKKKFIYRDSGYALLHPYSFFDDEAAVVIKNIGNE